MLAIVGNEPTSTNPLPAKSEIKMRVCCGVPDRLSLFLLRPYRSSCSANVSCLCVVTLSMRSYKFFNDALRIGHAYLSVFCFA